MQTVPKYGTGKGNTVSCSHSLTHSKSLLLVSTHDDPFCAWNLNGNETESEESRETVLRASDTQLHGTPRNSESDSKDFPDRLQHKFSNVRSSSNFQYPQNKSLCLNSLNIAEAD
jgi:hypothetical protein